jgi:hypothetical protein
MIKSVFSTVGSEHRVYLVGLVVLLLLALGIALTWPFGPALPVTAPESNAVPAGAGASETEAVAARSATALSSANAHTAQLDQLRRHAQIVAGRDGATVFALRLETLARTGREEWPAAGGAFSTATFGDYLDHLRRLGQAVNATAPVPEDPDGYSEWLAYLRRLGQ